MCFKASNSYRLQSLFLLGKAVNAYLKGMFYHLSCNSFKKRKLWVCWNRYMEYVWTAILLLKHANLPICHSNVFSTQLPPGFTPCNNFPTLGWLMQHCLRVRTCTLVDWVRRADQRARRTRIKFKLASVIFSHHQWWALKYKLPKEYMLQFYKSATLLFFWFQ